MQQSITAIILSLLTLGLFVNLSFGQAVTLTGSDTELKSAAERVFKVIGLQTSEAIQFFLQQCVNPSRLSFRHMPNSPIPNL